MLESSSSAWEEVLEEVRYEVEIMRARSAEEEVGEEEEKKKEEEDDDDHHHHHHHGPGGGAKAVPDSLLSITASKTSPMMRLEKLEKVADLLAEQLTRREVRDVKEQVVYNSPVHE